MVQLFSTRRTEQAAEAMEPCPVPLQGLLLTASLLTFWNVAATAQLTVEAVPPNAVEGQDALLPAHSEGQKFYGYIWYKGSQVDDSHLIIRHIISTNITVTGPAFTGRETVYPNGSLLLQNLTLNDSGVYTLQKVDEVLHSQNVVVKLSVYPLLPKPSIRSNNSDPVEGEDSVALTCEPKSEGTTYHWRVNGQNLPEDARLQLSTDNTTLILLSVTRNDTGPYQCETWNPVSANRSDSVSLNVLYGPDTPTIFPSEFYFQAGTNLNLSCQAASNPPSQYSWFISGIPQSSSSALLIPNITTNDSGSYSCFVNNSVTGLNRTAVKNITILEPVTQPSIQTINSTVVEDDSVTLTCLSEGHAAVSIRWLFNNEELRLTDRMKLTRNNSVLTIDPVWRADAGLYQCEVSNPVSSRKSGLFRLVVLFDPTRSPGLSGGAIAGIVVGSVAGVTLAAALAYFLYFRKTGGASDGHHLTEHKLSASNHSQGPFENHLSKVDEIAYSALNFNAQQPNSPAPASPTPAASETIYSEVKKK